MKLSSKPTQSDNHANGAKHNKCNEGEPLPSNTVINNNTQDALSSNVHNTPMRDNTQPAESQNVPNPTTQEGLHDVDTIRQTIQQTQIEPVISFQYSSEGTTSSTISVDFTTMDDITGQSSTPTNRHVSQATEEDSSSTIVSQQETPPEYDTTEIGTEQPGHDTNQEQQQIDVQESESGQEKVCISQSLF